MKLLIEREQIIKGLQKAASLSSQKTGTTFLKAVWLKWGGNKLQIMATDSKMEFIGVYPVNSEGEGIVGINGKSFYELIKKLPPGEISLTYSSEEDSILLEQGPRKYKILTYDSSWFRDFIPFPEDGYVKWNGSEFKELINRLYYFSSDEEDSDRRYIVLKRYKEENKIISFAMLLHSLGVKIFEHKGIYNLLNEEGYLIDRIFLNELKKWLENNEINLTIHNNRLFIKDIENNENISFPLIQKDITDYSAFFSPFEDNNTSKLTIKREELIEVLNRLYIFVSDIDEVVKFIFNNSELIIYTESYDKGEASESILVDYDGNLDEVVFLVKRTRDIIEHFYSKEIKFEFTHKEGPCKITGLEDIDKGYFIITMPVKIREELYYEDEVEENYDGE